MENEARRADISTEEIEDFFEKSKGCYWKLGRYFDNDCFELAHLVLRMGENGDAASEKPSLVLLETSKTRQVAKQEKLKACPPCLRKHKFQPAPVQVLLSEEINGSIRKLKVGL
ncbi:hypothetical protein P8452_44359 [Trifolium repens]|nr:hypothetical protein P8452_44359 [Trifolium repens]